MSTLPRRFAGRFALTLSLVVLEAAGWTLFPLVAGANDAYPVADVARLQTVVETPAYLAAARGVLTDDLRAKVVSMVAENPDAGVPLGGGVRKVRIARPGGGKSGGARVVFLSAGEDMPVFLLTVFAKTRGRISARGNGRP